MTSEDVENRTQELWTTFMILLCDFWSFSTEESHTALERHEGE